MTRVLVKDALPQLALFEIDPLPKGGPPKAKRKPQKGCPDCGAGTDISGHLCNECRGPRRRSEGLYCTGACCPAGECRAIPY